jgi:hypothetical protein
MIGSHPKTSAQQVLLEVPDEVHYCQKLFSCGCHNHVDNLQDNEMRFLDFYCQLLLNQHMFGCGPHDFEMLQMDYAGPVPRLLLDIGYVQMFAQNEHAHGLQCDDPMEHIAVHDQHLDVELALSDMTDLFAYGGFLFEHGHRHQEVVPLVHLADHQYRSIPADNPLVLMSYLVFP